MTDPGWYQAEGDPVGTVRWWDGTTWIGEPTTSGSAANTIYYAAPAEAQTASTHHLDPANHVVHRSLADDVAADARTSSADLSYNPKHRGTPEGLRFLVVLASCFAAWWFFWGFLLLLGLAALGSVFGVLVAVVAMAPAATLYYLQARAANRSYRLMLLGTSTVLAMLQMGCLAFATNFVSIPSTVSAALQTAVFVWAAFDYSKNQ